MGFYGNTWLQEASFKDKLKKKAIIARVNLSIKDGYLKDAEAVLVSNGIQPNTKDPDYYKLWEKIGIPKQFRRRTNSEMNIINKFINIVSTEAKPIIDKYNKNTQQLEKLSKEKTFIFQTGIVSNSYTYDEKKKKFKDYVSITIFKPYDQDGEFANRLISIINKIITDIKNNSKITSFKDITITDIYYDIYTFCIDIEFYIND